MSKKIIFLIIAFLVVINLFLVFNFVIKNSDSYKFDVTADSKKFKKEYESVNGEVYTGGKKYIELDLPKANPFVYLTYDEVIEFLENGNGILFFSRPGCPYCRSTIPSTIEFAKRNKIDTIYYYNPEVIRAENNDEYKKLLSVLDSYLPVDRVTQKDEDENFNPALKRIVVPQIFFVSKGEVVFTHQEGRTEFSDILSVNQEEEIISIYESGYLKYKNSSATCSPIKQEDC